MPLHSRRRARAIVCAALFLALVPATGASAAAPPCPLATDDLVAQSVGTGVKGGIMTDFISDNPLDTGPDKTVCWWDTDADTVVQISRQTNAFGPGAAAGPAEFAQTLFRVPDEARAEVDALNQTGVSNIELPNYALTSASGLGDAAVWVYQSTPSLNINSGGFVVQRGADALVFGIVGPTESDAKAQANTLAQAVLATLAP
jgi:hypothetical protein